MVAALQTGELLRDGRTQRLPQQPLRVLVELLEHSGQVVTRERLVQVLWPKGVVDFDNNLNSIVRKLRVALEEWLRRIPDFELADPDGVTWSQGTVRGPRRLPVRIGH